MAGEDNMIFGNLPPQIDWNAPPQPTFPANPADSRYSMPARIGSALGIEAGRIGRGLWSAATLPGDVATGKTTMADPQAQRRLMDLTQATTLGPGGGAEAPVSAFTTGWAPAAWQRIKQISKTEPEVADKIASLTPAEAPDYFFDKNAHNSLLSDVITQHMQDQHLVTRTTSPPPEWQRLFGPLQDVRDFRAQLDDLRGRPIAPFGVPPGQVNLGSGGPRRQWTAQEPSVFDTFRLKQPNMPPFPANDLRPRPPRVPGITIDSTELGA